MNPLCPYLGDFVFVMTMFCNCDKVVLFVTSVIHSLMVNKWGLGFIT